MLTRARAVIGRLAPRHDPVDTALLCFPLFLVYQVGIAAGGTGRNGADLVTSLLIDLCRRDLPTYLALFATMLLGYGLLLRGLRRRGRFHPDRFVPLLLESSFYAATMGSLILFAMQQLGSFVPWLADGPIGADPSWLEILVISAGAGLHEELFFRVGLMGGCVWFLGRRGSARFPAWMIALFASALVFSAAHHVGPLGEPFSTAAFVYRTFAGIFFGVLYWLRGLAVAAWTHALYDVYVLSIAT